MTDSVTLTREKDYVNAGEDKTIAYIPTDFFAKLENNLLNIQTYLRHTREFTANPSILDRQLSTLDKLLEELVTIKNADDVRIKRK